MEYGYFLQDVLTAAEAAEQRRDHRAAARYYRAIVKAVPDRAKGFTKLCEALRADGQTAEALKACELALTKEGVVADDFVRYARLLLAKSGDLTAAEVDDVKGVVAHLRGQPVARVFGHHLECELATRRDDATLLESCTAGLVKDAPRDPKTISFQWALALKRREHGQALALIARAREAGVSAEGIARMEAATTAIRPFWKAMFLDLRYLGLGAVAIGALGLLLAGRRRRAAPASQKVVQLP
jgi:hypothetical protein